MQMIGKYFKVFLYRDNNFICYVNSLPTSLYNDVDEYANYIVDCMYNDGENIHYLVPNSVNNERILCDMIAIKCVFVTLDTKLGIKETTNDYGKLIVKDFMKEDWVIL